MYTLRAELIPSTFSELLSRGKLNPYLLSGASDNAARAQCVYQLFVDSDDVPLMLTDKIMPLLEVHPFVRSKALCQAERVSSAMQ